MENQIVLPHAIDVEEIVLGAIILEKEAFAVVSEILIPECFYKEAHATMYSVCQTLAKKNIPIDMVTLFQELTAIGKLEACGGVSYVSNLTRRVASSANIEHHARIILQKYLQRELARVCTYGLNAAYSPTTDSLDLLSHVQHELENISKLIIPNKARTTVEIVKSTVEQIKIAKTNDGVLGPSTGLKALDEILRGLRKTNVMVVAGRPAMGKSALIVCLAKSLCLDQNLPVAIFSLEMSSEQLILRLLSDISDIDNNKLASGKLTLQEEAKLALAAERINNNFHVDDTPSITIQYFESRIRKLVAQGVHYVIIDYLQLMELTEKEKKGRNREGEISYLTRNIKRIAKKYNICIIELSQLSRSCEEREPPRPMLSDLRECLSVESSFIYTQKNVLSNANSRINLLSLNKKGKIIKNMSDNIPKSKNDVFRLKLASGRFVDCTLNHKILTSDGYKKLQDITIDDSVACGINFEDNQGEYVSESKFIGWMIGNGCMYGYNVPSFITNDRTVSDNFVKFIESKFGFSPKNHPHYKSKVFQWDITKSSVRTPEGNPVTNWLKENDLWGNKAQTKVIPQWFLEKANSKSIYELLAGLWETDGSIHTGKKEVISYATTSFVLAQQIIFLLAKIGIFANIDQGYKSKKATCLCYKITIESAVFKKVFASKIILSGHKSKKLSKMNFATIPSKYINKIGVNTTKEIASAYSKIPQRSERIQTHGNRQTTSSHLEKIFNDAKKLKDKSLAKYEWLVSNSIVWNPVVSISKIGSVDIFDRSVPGTNNFIVNGIIVHNSGAIEQDADIVILLYRPEYYNIEWTKDQKPTKGLAELIIAKHRGGAVDAVAVKYAGEYTRFYDLPEKTEAIEEDQQSKIYM